MTVINRRTFMAEQGKLEGALAILREGTKGSQYKYRIYSSYYGTFDTLALEIEFESVAQMEAAWAEINARPEMADLMAKWYTATQAGGANEVWMLEAQG
jgi:hypothetical protein